MEENAKAVLIAWDENLNKEPEEIVISGTSQQQNSTKKLLKRNKKSSEATLISWNEGVKETNEEYLIGEELDGDVTILPEDRIRNLLNDEKINNEIKYIVDKYYSKIEGEELNEVDKRVIVNYIKSLYELKLEKKIAKVEPYLLELYIDMNAPNFSELWTISGFDNSGLLKIFLKRNLGYMKSLSERIEKQLDKSFKITKNNEKKLDKSSKTTKNKKKHRLKKLLKKMSSIIKKIKDIIKSMICYKKPKDNEKDKNKQHLRLNKESIKSMQSKSKITNAPNKIEYIPCINSTKGKNVSIELTK